MRTRVLPRDTQPIIPEPDADAGQELDVVALEGISDQAQRLATRGRAVVLDVLDRVGGHLRGPGESGITVVVVGVGVMLCTWVGVHAPRPPKPSLTPHPLEEFPHTTRCAASDRTLPRAGSFAGQVRPERLWRWTAFGGHGSFVNRSVTGVDCPSPWGYSEAHW